MAASEFGESTEFDPALGSALLAQGFLYGLPDGTVLVGYGEVTWQKEQPKDRPAFYIPDFFLLPGGVSLRGAWAVPSHLILATRVSVVEALEGLIELSPQVDPLIWHQPDFHSFRRRFLQIQREIKSGRWSKAVPVVFERSQSPLQPAHIAQALLGALRAPQPLIPYGVWSRQWGMVGASPELFASVREGRGVYLAALAGTVSRDQGPEALTRDPKQLHEHQLVIDFLAQSLSSIGEVQRQPTEVQVLPQLLHLRTAITAYPRNPVGLFELARLLHPSPALGVSPRHLGWEWLRDIDREVPRGNFGAPFGVQWPDGSAESCIAIRAMQWRPRPEMSGSDGIPLEILIGSGCGVVAESELESEWEELAAKRDSVHHMLGV